MATFKDILHFITWNEIFQTCRLIFILFPIYTINLLTMFYDKAVLTQKLIII